MRFLLACLVVLLSLSVAYSQQVIVRGGFISDSIRVGDEISFYLTARYQRSQQIVFPDSAHFYQPFEFSSKLYFATRTKDSLSYDSAVYKLRTFEVDQDQTLRLPVFLVNALDCTRVFSNRDTIRIRQLVRELPDSISSDLPLKATVDYMQVSRQINYPLIIIAVSFVFLFGAVGWIALAPAARKLNKKRKLKRLHNNFIAEFDSHLISLTRSSSPAETEIAIALWKKYMEDLSRKPYTKLTTKETALLEKDELLQKNLRAVDRAVYGHGQSVVQPLESLKSYAELRFQNILANLDDGK
jgi:hypothetical protein